jgi:general stress protein CsbA
MAMDWKVIRGTLTVLGLAFYISAIFLPWLSERYHALVSPLQPEIFPPPPIPEEGLFWSFQALISYHGRYRFSDRLLFCNYWFGREGLYLGWFGVFFFQVLTAILVFISIFKEKMKGRKLYVIATAVVSMTAPILCVCQRSKQIERSWLVDATEFSLGFWLAIASAILFFISFWISSWTERRVSISKAEPIL